jgi:hypothetical protein
MTDAGPFDVLARLEAAATDISSSTRSILQGDGFSIRAASLDDIVQAKERANRPKDHETLPELRALRDRNGTDERLSDYTEQIARVHRRNNNSSAQSQKPDNRHDAAIFLRTVENAKRLVDAGKVTNDRLLGEPYLIGNREVALPLCSERQDLELSSSERLKGIAAPLAREKRGDELWIDDRAA